jgi:hypothetical protein
MNPKLKRYFLTSVKQIAILMAIFAVISSWQTRAMPKGKAPVVSVTALDGESFEIPNTQTPKITLIYFFAPWCAVCRASMRNLDAVREWVPALAVHAVALDYESTESVLNFVREVGVTSPVAFGHSEVREAWKISGYPSYVIIGKDQDIQSASIGYSSQLGMLARVLWAKFYF